MSTPYGIQITENCLLCKLRQKGFFFELPKPAWEEMEKVKYASAYPQGAVLFLEGQAPRGVYVICSGRVKLSTTSRDGKTLILRIAQAEKCWACTLLFRASRMSLLAKRCSPASWISSVAKTS